MLNRRFKNPVFILYLLVIYVTLQFGWWLFLIYRLYNQLYVDDTILQKKTIMLLGEGSVFFVILIIGVSILLRAFKQERELNQQQENFVLSVTHELKTPISSVKLFLQTLQKRELSPEKREEIYDRSLLEINRLDSLVNNLLLTRSIENNNYFLYKAPLNLKEFISEKLSLLEKSILKDHKISINLTEVTLEVDHLGFESIFVNLIENAAKYSPAGSTITVRLEENKQEVVLTILDQGSGIDKKKRTRVFSKFYREENEMTRKSKGTGLGLYIVNFLVKKHNGQINLTENSPNGLIVSIHFKK
jgi:two-component system phosphate regulon sensor histidine kinase PhoR